MEALDGLTVGRLEGHVERRRPASRPRIATNRYRPFGPISVALPSPGRTPSTGSNISLIPSGSSARS